MKHSLKKSLYRFWTPVHVLYADDPPAGDPPAGDPPAQSPVSFETLSGDTWAELVQSKFKDNSVVMNTKSAEDAITQLINAQKLVGSNKVALPGENASEDEWAEFFSKVGRPDTADDYKLGEDLGLPEDLMQVMKAQAHKLGYTNKQLNELLGTYKEWAASQAETSEAERIKSFEAAEAELKGKYGDLYEAKVHTANNLIGKFGTDEISKRLEETGLGNDPKFIDMMIKIADQFADDTAIGEALNTDLSSVNQAKREIASLRADDTFQKKLFDAGATGHKEALIRWQELHKKAFPG